MRERWPWLMQEVAEALGDDAALKLVSKYGGQLVSIPRKSSGSMIEDALGEDIAALLVDLRGGEAVEIPNFGARLPEERRRFILTHPDLSANDCAQRLGLTRRRVLQIRSETRADPRQFDLFEA